MNNIKINQNNKIIIRFFNTDIDEDVYMFVDAYVVNKYYDVNDNELIQVKTTDGNIVEFYYNDYEKSFKFAYEENTLNDWSDKLTIIRQVSDEELEKSYSN